MADPQTGTILDPAAQEEYVRQLAARRTATPTVAQPTLPAQTQSLMPAVKAPAAAPAPPVAPVAQMHAPSANGMPPVAGSTEDLESRIQPPSAATARAAAQRGNLPSQVEARADAMKGTPEDQEATRAEQKLSEDEAKKAGVERVMDASKNIGSDPDSFMGRHPGIAKIARTGAEIGSGLLRGVETAGDIVAPRIAARIPGTELNRQVRLGQDEEAVSDAEKNRLQEAQSEEQRATAAQKASMQGQITAAREKGFDLTQNPITGAWEMHEDPTFAQRAAGTKDLEPKIEVSPDSGAVVQLSPDPKNPGQMVSSPVLDAAGKPTILPPKPQGYDIKEELQADGKVHNVAYDKADPSKKIVLGESKPSGSANEGKVYDNYSKQLETAAKPVEAKLQDATYLQQQLAAKNPQSDALIAPKLLSITTGGQGSGLRMNEAEISRVIGGRNVWDSLKSVSMKVQTGVGSYDDNQRAQISAIVQYMQTRSAAASYVMDQARQQLLANQMDDKAVRTTYSNMNHILSQLDEHGITPQGTPLKPGDFVYRDGKLLEVEIENNKPVGVPVTVK
jgi:hypothetical protein